MNGKDIQNARKIANLSLRDLSALTGIAHTKIHRMETNIDIVAYGDVVRVLEALDLDKPVELTAHEQALIHLWRCGDFAKILAIISDEMDNTNT